MTKYGKLNDLASSPELEDASRLDEHFGKTLEIQSFITVQVGANECAVIQTDQGKISSFSKVIIDQLNLMKADLEAKVVFKVRPVKEKNYYKFEQVD